MRPFLRWAMLLSAGLAPGARAEAPVAAAPITAPTTAPATQPVLDEAARELVRILRNAEARTGVRRLYCDQDGKIRALFLSSSYATDENLHAAASLPDVTFIRISGSWSGLSASGLGELRRLHHLERLELRYAVRQFNLEHGMALAKISSLRSLSITCPDADPQAIAFLCALPQLATLEVRSCRAITDSNVAALTQLRKLEYLDLTYTGVSGASLDVLSVLPHLKQLTVSGTSVTDEDVARSKLVGKVAVRGAKVKPPPNADAS